MKTTVSRNGLGVETLASLYRHFLTQLVPFDESDIRCSAGCGYCCHLRVNASVAEVVVIVSLLAESGLCEQYRICADNASDCLEARAAREDGWWWEHSVPCLFLDDIFGDCRQQK